MTLPEGFAVELVASEPDIVNPVAMTFDERGRVWITESLEYPRQEPGPGRDRVKVLEDTDGDGRADKFTVFAEGFNIPSGIAVGYGGVWLANAPDILFLSDTDGDGRADKREVVVSGFGRDDTHELPNSLTWGPDGWLYGLNGVFNPSHVSQNGKQFDFTCALFRIHPRTREFQVFAQGTSNPWGIAWDVEGSAFVSACVIDHLWHLAETGYYIRQGGPYPPFTAPMGSIVEHKHQKAAYCGIHYFDSDAYPEPYRQRLFMGNIHGNAVNVDVLTRSGSTYVGTAGPDFLVADDAWFMPVVQKTGPDGCLYILDWYDRYHCYQDARRDPEGIDRLKGRLYRVRYRDTPRAGRFDLAAETDGQLVERLRSPNVFYRDVAQRILCERARPESRPVLESLVFDEAAPLAARMHGLWSLIGSGGLSLEFHLKLLSHAESPLRSWGVRAAGNMGRVDDAVRQRIVALAHDPQPDVRLQVAIAARKIERLDALSVLLEVLARSEDDKLIPHIVWQNLHPLLEENGERFVELVSAEERRQSPAVAALMPRAVDRVLAAGRPNSIAALAALVFADQKFDPTVAQKCLASLNRRLQSRDIAPAQFAVLRPRLEPLIQSILAQGDHPMRVDAALVACAWNDSRGLEIARTVFVASEHPIAVRGAAFDALVASGDPSLERSVAALFSDGKEQDLELRARVLASLAHLDAPWVSRIVLAHYGRLEPSLRSKAIELLTERRGWAEMLIEAIQRNEIPRGDVNVNQVRQLMLRADDQTAPKIAAIWGAVRAQRDPRREEVIAEMRAFLRHASGDAKAGQAVFNRVCGQCHKLFGTGQEVGPDITLNGRNSFEQLLSNVFDPSLVVGAAYQARTIVTEDGRVLTGLVAEESPRHIVLKMQGGKQETVSREDISQMKTSALSLMPEDLEKQLKPRELADLFALLTLDKPPDDPQARRLPGSLPPTADQTSDAARFGELVRQIAPAFSTTKVGKPGLAIIAEHAGREGVLLTRPVSRQEPCVLRTVVDVPAAKRTQLQLCVSHASRGAWKLIVKSGEQKLYETVIESNDPAPSWRNISVDLSPLAGKRIELEVLNGSHDSRIDAAYWSGLEIVSD